MVGWVFFRADTLPHAMNYLNALFFGAGNIELTDLWTRELTFIMAVAIPACTPIMPWCIDRLAERDESGWRMAGLEWAALAACGVLWVALLPCLCAGSYNPFLYFRF